jgi:hypothetical protein
MINLLVNVLCNSLAYEHNFFVYGDVNWSNQASILPLHCKDVVTSSAHAGYVVGFDSRQRTRCCWTYQGGHFTRACFEIEGNVSNLRRLSQNPWQIANATHKLKLLGLSPRANYTDRADRRLSAKLVSTFENRGCHVGRVTDPYGRIFGFLDLSRYFFFFQAAPQLYSRGWLDPVSDPLLLRISERWESDLGLLICRK